MKQTLKKELKKLKEKHNLSVDALEDIEDLVEQSVVYGFAGLQRFKKKVKAEKEMLKRNSQI